jgi:outer membrane receptor for ferric coprogen and ferric-rhodotorulic acid
MQPPDSIAGRRARHRLFRLPIRLLALLAFVDAAAGEANKRTYTLPADAAERSIKLFAEQSGRAALAGTTALRNVRTNAVRGEFSAREALDQMLVSTGLVAKEDPQSGAFVISREEPSPNVPRTAPAAASSVRPNAEALVSATAGETVEMSPFTVQAEKETGYHASSALSGTRTNSKIEDLASSISVVTKAMFEDTAAFDLNDIFLYEANTEGTGNFTSFSVNRSGEIDDRVQSAPQSANRIRGLGSANMAVGNFGTSLPLDTYNIDSAEISRGPNSNLFGLGGSGGTVNLNAAVARLDRASARMQLTADSYGGRRSSLDLNSPLLKNRLGIRVLGVYDAKGFERKPSVDRTRRLTGTVTFKPFPKTTIRGTYETYDNWARRPNSTTPRDTVTSWRSAGSPTWDPVTFQPRVNGVLGAPIRQNVEVTALPAGLNTADFPARPSLYIDDGRVQLWMVNRLTNGTNPNSPNTDLRILYNASDIQKNRTATQPLFTMVGISDRSLYDWQSVNFVASNWSTRQADTYRIEIEQSLLNTSLHKLDAQVAWYYEDGKATNRNQISGAAPVYLDINERLLDGTPNPFFLRPFISASIPIDRRSPGRADDIRAQLFYELNLTHQKNWLAWLGRHRAMGYAEGRFTRNGTMTYREVVLDNHIWTSATNRANGAAAGTATYRYYLGDNKGYNVEYAPPLSGVSGTYALRYATNAGTASQAWVAENAVIGETPYQGNFSAQQVRTQGMVLQSYWWQDRIVTMLGARTDKSRSRNADVARLDPATGLTDVSLANGGWGSWLARRGTTRTNGVVVKPLRHVSLFYNQSDSFQPQPIVGNLYGQFLPDTTGKGRDYGFNVSFLGGKLVARISQYETYEKNARTGDSGIIADRINNMEARNSTWNMLSWTRAVVIARYQTQGIVPSETQVRADTSKMVGMDYDFLATLSTNMAVGESQDFTSRGKEFDITYNPTRHWRLRLTAAQQRAFDAALAPSIQTYIAQRMPIWTTLKDDQGNLWWNNSNVSTWWNNSVYTPLAAAKANQGKPRSQVREWRWALTNNYTFASGPLKGTGVGGAARWEDKASIGYRGSPDTDGIIRVLDPNRPVWDKARAYYDLWASHSLKLYNDKIGARVQLNCRNAFEGGRLQVVGVNPDGTPYNFRIIDPRQWILSVAFDL